MAVPKQSNLRVVSRGYDLRSDHDKAAGKRISIDKIAAETGLSMMTVRRFVSDKDADVSGSPLLAAAIIADYFGVDLGAMLRIETTRLETTGTEAARGEATEGKEE